MFRPTIVEFINTDLSQPITMAIDDFIVECDEDHGGARAYPLAKKIFATVTPSQPFGTTDLSCWREMGPLTCPNPDHTPVIVTGYYKMVLAKDGIYNVVR